MPPDEALLVYAYLQHVPQERRTSEERAAFDDAWGTIIAYAKQAIQNRHSR